MGEEFCSSGRSPPLLENWNYGTSSSPSTLVCSGSVGLQVVLNVPRDCSRTSTLHLSLSSGRIGVYFLTWERWQLVSTMHDEYDDPI